MSRTFLEKARCMRLFASLSKLFWAEAINMTCYIVNRLSCSTIDAKVLEEVWTRKLVDYSNLRIFGCPAYVYVQEQQRSKLNPKSKKCIFIGYEKCVKCYKLWDPIAQRVVISKDVVFNEEHILNLNKEDVDKQVEAHAEKFSVQIESDHTQWPS